jgi:type IV pilus assembly protein PilQ
MSAAGANAWNTTGRGRARLPTLVCVLALAALFASPRVYAATARLHATAITLRSIAANGTTQVTATFTGEPTFTARLERGGRRLIVDVPGADVRGAPGALTRQVGVVGGVMSQAFATGDSFTTRILITLIQDAKYSVRVDGNRVVATFLPGATGALSPVALRTAQPAPPAATEPVRVMNVRFNHDSLEDKILIDLSGVPRFKKSSSGDDSTLTLFGAELPQALARTLDVTAYDGPVSTISSFAAPKKAGAVVVEVHHADGLMSQVDHQGSTLVWSFFKPGSLPSSMTGIASDGGVARRARTVHVDPSYSDIPAVHSGYDAEATIEQASAADQADAFTPSVLGQTRHHYSGRRIDLDLKEADIHNVLRLIADVGRVNIVAGDNVTGTVTIRMRNVPWDQALDVILQAKNLGVVRQGNMLRVAPLAELEKERELAIARAKQELQLAPIETRLIPVSYAQATDLQARAKELLSPRGSIAVDERTNTMIVRDVAGNLDQVEQLVRALDTQTPQILVEARIVEATSSYLRDVGIQWGGNATFAAASGNATGLAFPNSIGIVGGASDTNTPTGGLSPFNNTVANPNFAVNLPATVGTDQGGALGLTFGSIDNTINLAVRLSAAESSGLVRILSSPRVLTLDNRDARIAQGTLIPYSQISAQGVQTTFQEAKLQLLVKPHVTADGSIAMHVKINRDEPDFNQTAANGAPTILKREAETDLLVADGHTAVIGGIFTRNTGRNLDQVPFFGDIPLIGLLFQRRQANDSRSELVIFLTPRIVNRAAALGH